MAVSQIEEKILGRLAKETLTSNEDLATSLYQVLGLSIMLSRKLVKARRYRRLDTSRNTKSLQLYHHIIWLAREGLLITEHVISPHCLNGQRGGEYRVMAAKLRASFYHILCLFHNHPSFSPVNSRVYETGGSPSSVLAPKADNGQTRQSGKKRQNDGTESGEGPRRKGKAPLRDPVLSMTSDTSYVTNPYTSTQAQTPPPTMPPPPIPTAARRTPSRPPVLSPISIPANAASASFLLPALDYVPIAKEYFTAAQYLASNLLFPANPLRLSLSLEHAAFLQDCSNEPERARRLARGAIKDVYASSEGLDDEEFADASTLVQLLGGVVRRSSDSNTTAPSSRSGSRPTICSPPRQRAPPATDSQVVPPIDRTIAVSPSRTKSASPSHLRTMLRTPERLATVPEVSSATPSPKKRARGDVAEQQKAAGEEISPPISRLSSRGSRRQQQSRKSPTSSPPSNRSSERRTTTDGQWRPEGGTRDGDGSPSTRTNVSGVAAGYVAKSPPSRDAS